jgi:excisionase family DNA binding protein
VKGAPDARRLVRVALTVRAVARRLGVCTATVYKICKAGRFEHVRVSNAIRVPEAALAKYLGIP